MSKLRWKQYYLTKKNNELTEKLNSTKLCDFVNAFLKGMHFKNCAFLVLELVHSGEMFGDAGKKVGMEFARQSVNSIMSEWRLCKTKDTSHQGCLNTNRSFGEKGGRHHCLQICCVERGRQTLKKSGLPDV